MVTPGNDRVSILQNVIFIWCLFASKVFEEFEDLVGHFLRESNLVSVVPRSFSDVPIEFSAVF